MAPSKEEILNIVQARQWNIQRFNGMPLYLISNAVNSGWVVKDKFNEGYTHFFFLFSKGSAFMYYDEEDWTNICRGYYANVKTRAQLEEIIANDENNFQAVTRKILGYSQQLDSLSTTDLIGGMKNFCAWVSNAVGFSHAIEGITFGSEKALKKIIDEKGQFSEQEYGVLCSPVHSSFIAKAQQSLWSIRNLPQEERKQAIDQFINEYGWIENTYLSAKEFSAEDVVNRASGVKEEPVFNIEDLIKQKEELTKRLSLSDAEKFIVETIELCFYWQDERKKHILQTIGIFEQVVSEISKRFNIEVATLKFITPQEISEENFRDPSFISQLKERREKSVYYCVPDQNYIFINDDYDFFSHALHVAFDNNGKELKGTTGCPGIVRGVVRVCESVSDIDKIQKGEILVASMTRPEYLPAMQKAIAFVTDEGGITSHAAIVAREMKKPCIIGTKIATKVLKDGDMVEVDADKGIVRKI